MWPKLLIPDWILCIEQFLDSTLIFFFLKMSFGSAGKLPHDALKEVSNFIFLKKCGVCF
jgi:hypothetical protein